jgi:hypothetical protein
MFATPFNNLASPLQPVLILPRIALLPELAHLPELTLLPQIIDALDQNMQALLAQSLP